MANMKQALTPKILSDSSHLFVQTLLYIYSMQSFIFSGMNKASREKDVSKIEEYGPLASALGFIIHCGNQRQAKIQNKFIIYRGLKITPEELK